ncbi:MAG: ABC transporter ATP-binding protein [Ignavibacteria bacterium]|nr:ABC transporter ATP-binding protein [Ignavibacteria bacterium]
MIELVNVSKIFENKTEYFVQAVDEITLGIRSGEIISIAGPSGSGKTTLLSMIGGLISPTTGRIFIYGVETTKLSQRKLTELRLNQIGYIFQTFRLLDALTVQENVILPLMLSGKKNEESNSIAKELLNEVKLSHRAKFMPAKLSGGEKQRVAIARALANEPKIILADEPTGSLDSKSGQNIIELICKMAKEKNKTVIIVTHDERIQHYADRVIHMEDGKIN